MNEPGKPDVEEQMNPIQYAWYWLQLGAWYLWPANGCIYCFWYRGVGVGFLLGGVVSWLIMKSLQN